MWSFLFFQFGRALCRGDDRDLTFPKKSLVGERPHSKCGAQVLRIQVR